MEGSVAHSYLSDILHTVSQALLAPDIILLLVLIGYALFSIGGIIAEFFTERRYFQVIMPKFLAALMAAEEESLPAVIEGSGLVRRQKVALLTVYDYRTLPGDALVALIKRLVSEEEGYYGRITGRNSMAARVAPMLGLMGTLIPLGPGIQALGKADTAALSSSLLVAFDTTVAGLVVAAVCLVVGKIRSRWYDNYMSALDSAMATMLQKIEDMREAGLITAEQPSNYAFLYEQTSGPVSPSSNFLKGILPGRDSGEQAPKAEPASPRAERPAPRERAAQAPASVPKRDAAVSLGAAATAPPQEPTARPASRRDPVLPYDTDLSDLFGETLAPSAAPAEEPRSAFPRPVFMDPPVGSAGRPDGGVPSNPDSSAR